MSFPIFRGTIRSLQRGLNHDLPSLCNNGVELLGRVCIVLTGGEILQHVLVRCGHTTRFHHL